MKKSILSNLGILLLFIIAACIYCSPVLEGKIIVASDTIGGSGAVQEGKEYHEKTGNRSWWTGSMFGGMPNYQIGGGQTFTEKITDPLLRVVRWGHRNQIFVLIYYMLAFYVLMRAFGVQRWMSVAGAFAVAFSSYFFIILAAAHNGKATSITWMTLVLVGMLLIFRRRYWLGGLMVAFFMFAGYTPHPQMTFYMAMLIGVLFFAELYQHIKAKKYKEFLIGSVVFFVSLLIGFGSESSRVFANMEYAEETMRGGHSELVKDTDPKNRTKGLDLDYATQWSYGISETMTFLIPNYMGAASGYNVGDDSALYKALTSKGVPHKSAHDFCSAAPTYWGDQPFTVGPVYMGAIICFLFVLALFLTRGAYKWALLIATLFSVCLSWGHNFMPLTEFFFHYFPMYNKFRAVSSILIVAEITVPLLGFLAIKAIADKEVSGEKIKKGIMWSAGITGGICLVLALFGSSILSFTSANDLQFKDQLPDWAYQAIVEQRISMLRSDAFRSLIFILLGAGVVWMYAQEKLKTAWAALALGGLILIDMWVVDKRFLNNDSFKDPNVLKQAFAMQPYEEQLLKDTTHFRVFNTTVSPFQDSRTSYYLKSVGGYSAAKLRRYQDLIDEHLSKMNMNVFNMLNTKYFIMRTESGEVLPQLNPDALGNAWYVDSLVVVDTPNEESDALNTLDLRKAAVLDKQFAGLTEGFVPQADSLASVKLTKYTPEYIEYESNAAAKGTVVFSEIYYPYGWKAYIDGLPTEHYRVNYMLRAMNVPEGKHHIRFEFRPDSIEKGSWLAMICLGILFVGIVGYAGKEAYTYWRKRKV